MLVLVVDDAVESAGMLGALLEIRGYSVAGTRRPFRFWRYRSSYRMRGPIDATSRRKHESSYARLPRVPVQQRVSARLVADGAAR